jgi:hypothetical protein
MRPTISFDVLLIFRRADMYGLQIMTGFCTNSITRKASSNQLRKISRLQVEKNYSQVGCDAVCTGRNSAAFRSNVQPCTSLSVAMNTEAECVGCHHGEKRGPCMDKQRCLPVDLVRGLCEKQG